MTNEFASLALTLCAWFISVPCFALIIKLIRDVSRLVEQANDLNEKLERFGGENAENSPRK